MKRAKEGFAYSEESSPEKRKQLVENHFKSHIYLTVEDYRRLTGLLKGKALRELHKWVEEGYLGKQGAAPHMVFIKKSVIAEE